LLNWGYTAFDAIKLFEANQAVVSPTVWKGKDNSIGLGREYPIVVAVPAGSAGRIKTMVARPDPIVAPIAKGQTVGTLKVSLGDQAYVDMPLAALHAVDEAGIVGRTWDAIRMWIK
jgi:serine-type D-Ala-D-Ala carboxypeptidase (penicillin-binding protein 5/6)